MVQDFSIHVKLKSCRTENKICLVEVYKNVVTRPMLTDAKTKDSGSKKFATVSRISYLFSTKEARILAEVNDSLRHESIFFLSADFLSKVTIPYSKSSFNLLTCHEQAPCSLEEKL